MSVIGRGPVGTVKSAALAGWLIGVMVDAAEEDRPVREFYAVGKTDQALAEWAAVDAVVAGGVVAGIPVHGQETVAAVCGISADMAGIHGLKANEVRLLGRRLPRRWLGR